MAAVRAKQLGQDDAHFRDLLARLPAHMVAPPDMDEAAAEKFYKNKGQKAPEAERKAATKQRRVEARASRDAKRVEAGSEPSADFDGLGDSDDEHMEESPLRQTGEPLDDVRKRLQERLQGFKSDRALGDKKVPRAKKGGAQKRKAAAKLEKEEERASKHYSKPKEEPKPDTQVGALRDARTEVLKPKMVQGAPGSKTRKLKNMLKRAEKDATEIRTLRAGGNDEAADNKQWDEALRVASGQRASVDPQKVKKALKMREKKKQKSAKEWAKRGRDAERHTAAQTVPSGKRAYDDDGKPKRRQRNAPGA